MRLLPGIVVAVVLGTTPSVASAQLPPLFPAPQPPTPDPEPAPLPPAQPPPTLTIYSSLPLQGAFRSTSLSIVNAMRLALGDAGGKAGSFPLRYIPLNDSSARAGTATPALEARNARRAVRDEAAAAYLGAFNSGVSKISIPILNKINLLQISPSNTYNGLTVRQRGDAGSPQKYYPTGERNFIRLPPRDTIQSDALALLMGRSGCRRVFLFHDGQIYGRELAANVRRFARRRGLRVVGMLHVPRDAPNYRAAAALVRRGRARCALYGGVTDNGAVALFRDIARAVPRVKLFAGDGVAELPFTDPRLGGVPAHVGRRVRFTASIIPAPSAYPSGGRDFFRRYRARYGKPPGAYAIHGYEAMRLAIDAVARAGTADRRAIVAAAFGTRDRDSVLGRYSVRPTGDTTLTDFAVFRIVRGRPRFAGAVRP